MDPLFRQFGIYSSVGQLYEPVDKDVVSYYKEAVDGQILEEGITEAGSMSSFIAAGSAYSTHGVNTIPFFVYYSMFGMQRIGDLVWLAGDMRVKGFMVGGTAGRTTLNGEGLQHEDGHSHLLAYPVPNLMAYDPAFAYEIAVIIRDGIRRMYVEQEDIFYYLTIENETYSMPAMPKGVEEGIIKGLYKFRASKTKRSKLKAQLFGSGAIMNRVIEAQKILEDQFNVSTDIWSITSFKNLHREALDVDRWNRMHPGEDKKRSYLEETLKEEKGVFVVASDYVKTLPESIARWFPKTPISLGTDGFGRSESREALRDFFEVDARFIVLGALSALSEEGKIEKSVSSIKESVRLAEYGMGFLGVSFILFPRFDLSVFTNDVSIIEMGVFGLRVAGALQFLDAVGFVLMFALTGAGNTVFPAIVDSVSTWVVVVFGTYFFAIHLGFGFIVPWLLFPLHMGFFAVAMGWKIYQGDWKEIEV